MGCRAGCGFLSHFLGNFLKRIHVGFLFKTLNPECGDSVIRLFLKAENPLFPCVSEASLSTPFAAVSFPACRVSLIGHRPAIGTTQL